MSNTAHRSQSSMGIAAPSSAGSAMSAGSAFAPASAREDAEERRWQLEWDRRNVED
ncbi:MAG: hypothetical protein QOI40_227 [Alphaproteobacteria bacterium]|jgi:hypothetical protein|nr:hypothetical protein [Alphaproteobacteria bacterium]